MRRETASAGRPRSVNGTRATKPRKGATQPTGAPAALATASLTEALTATCAQLASSLGYDGHLRVVRSATNAGIRSDLTAPILMIVGEAVANAIKYSHPTGVAGKIAVECNQDREGCVVVSVTDDGVGLPENFDPARDGDGGFRIMRTLSEKLGATLTFKSTPLGLRVRLRLASKSIAANGLSKDLAKDLANGLAKAKAPNTGSQPLQGMSEENGLSLRLLESLPAAVYVTDAAGRITFYNEAASALWGCRPQLGKSEFCGSWKLYWPDGTPLPHEECPMAMALKQKRAIHGMEAVAERPDGTRVRFLPYPRPLFDDQGALVGAINMLVDISEHKSTETLLAKHRDDQAALYLFTDKLFRAASAQDVYDSALDAIQRTLGCKRASILLFDEAGVMRFVASRGLSRSYQRAVEGHSPWTRGTKDAQPICIADIDSADLDEELRNTVQTEGIGALAFIPLMASGRLIGKFMTYYEAPHAFSETDVNLAVTIARQLGFSIERLGAEQGNHLLAAIIETSDDAIVSKDLNGVVTSWNRGAERIFGYTAHEMIGRSVMTLIPSDRQDEEPGILQRIRRGERIDHYETLRHRKDGTVIHVSLSVSPVKDATGKVVGASKIARDITERKVAQARQELLTREVQHRTKNLFAVVLAVVARSFAGKQTAKEAEASVMARLHSLAQTHAMLMDNEWQGADFLDVVAVEMSPYEDRVQVEGPSLVLDAKAAQNFALALHELATNAVKHGALSNATGRVHIGWSVTKSNGSGHFSFRWQERGGPPVSPPVRRGFGSTVLEQVMGEYFEVPPRITFAAGGVSYEINGPLDSVTMAPAPVDHAAAAGAEA
jgi:PAS domain S-box-containing protein